MRLAGVTKQYYRDGRLQDGHGLVSFFALENQWRKHAYDVAAHRARWTMPNKQPVVAAIGQFKSVETK